MVDNLKTPVLDYDNRDFESVRDDALERVPFFTPEWVPCACGCGKFRPRFDGRGRERKFIRGHSSRLASQKKVCCRRCQTPFIPTTARGQKYCSLDCRFPTRACECGCGGLIVGKAIETRFLPGHHWIGRKHTDEEKRKIGLHSQGEKNPNWRGGIAHKPYTREFVLSLRQQVYDEYGGKCGLCPTTGDGHEIHIHHIDYNKENNDPLNLMALCRSCHGRTNFNREYWQDYLSTLRLEVYHGG